MIDIGTSWMLGALLGLRHALEPDHLAAISTLLPEAPDSLRGASLGASWGVGHGLALLGFAGTISALRAQVPPWLDGGFELGVALALLVLGVRALAQAVREGRRGQPHHHRHGMLWHAHAGPKAHIHIGRMTLARRPLCVGFVHGLAGSGALTALVITGLPTALSRLGFVLLFSASAAAGMALLTGLAGWTLRHLRQRPGGLRALLIASGAASTLLGLLWSYPALERLLG
ncbi:MAG: hypothetical protein RMK29_07395 [Myxococcales bacterium]|nr:hypothetical protein [Myxococcota bacterium]MDW8281518.1 hypothetical protein [Myxococcales bacterium]